MDRLRPNWSYSSLCWQNTAHFAHWQPVSWLTKPHYPYNSEDYKLFIQILFFKCTIQIQYLLDNKNFIMPHRSQFLSIVFSANLAQRSKRHILWWNKLSLQQKGWRAWAWGQQVQKTKPLLQMDGTTSICGQQVIAPPPPLIHRCHHLVDEKAFSQDRRRLIFVADSSWKTVDNFCKNILPA